MHVSRQAAQADPAFSFAIILIAKVERAAIHGRTVHRGLRD
jgi:hypothetical protein